MCLCVSEIARTIIHNLPEGKVAKSALVGQFTVPPERIDMRQITQ